MPRSALLLALVLVLAAAAGLALLLRGPTAAGAAAVGVSRAAGEPDQPSALRPPAEIAEAGAQPARAAAAAREPWRAPLRGIAVEAATGAGVEELELRFASTSGALETLRTGAGGAFQGREPFPAGALEVDVRDPYWKLDLGTLRADFGPDAGPLRLEVPVGPAVRFTLGGPRLPPASELVARVQERGPGERFVPWRGAQPRGEEVLWIRYPPRTWSSEPRAQLELWVESASGDLAGRAPFERPEGLVAEVHVELRTLGTTLQGRVVAARPLRERVALRLLPLEGVAPRREWPRATSADDGTFSFPGLEPGHWRLLADGPCGRALARDLALVQGANDVGDLQLELAEGCGHVLGELRADGEPPPEALVRLLLDGDPARERTTVVSSPWSRSGGFSFPSVPPGEHVLEIVPWDGREYDAPRRTVRPGEAPALFLARGPSLNACVAVRPLDAADGATVGGVQVLALRGGAWIPWGALSCRHEHAQPPGWLQPFRGSPGDAWLVFGSDHLPARTALDATVPGPDRTRTAEPRLERGFALALLARRVDHVLLGLGLAPPVAGVRVVADGQLVATGDATGLALVTLPQRPERIEVRAPEGWIVLPAPDLADGRYRGPDGVAWLQLVRR